MGMLTKSINVSQHGFAAEVKQLVAELAAKTPDKKASELQFDVQRDGNNRIKGFRVTVIR
jgi:hypothetical protein